MTKIIDNTAGWLDKPNDNLGAAKRLALLRTADFHMLSLLRLITC